MTQIRIDDLWWLISVSLLHFLLFLFKFLKQQTEYLHHGLGKSATPIYLKSHNLGVKCVL